MSPCKNCVHYRPRYRRCGMTYEDRKPEARDCYWYDQKGQVKDDSEGNTKRDQAHGAGD